MLPEDELENFAGWYRHLVQASPESNVAFVNSLAETLDGFVSLQLDTTGASSRILRVNLLQAEKKRITYSLEELSDGQRCLIALYAILHFVLAKPAATVFIDEPDNFVSLREIQPWLLSAEETVEESKSQLILISHHPEILNYWARDFGLLFLREENGQVRTKPYIAVAETGLGPAETLARGWEDE
jgi:AAA15 family ATPase/GTPase